MLTELGAGLVNISNEKEVTVNIYCLCRFPASDALPMRMHTDSSFMAGLRVGQKHGRTKTLSGYKSTRRNGVDQQETRLASLHLQFVTARKAKKIYQSTFTLPVFLDLNPQG